MLVGMRLEVVAGFIGVRTWGGRIRPLTLGSFVGVQWGTHWGSSRSSAVAGVRRGGRSVHKVSLDSLRYALGVV